MYLEDFLGLTQRALEVEYVDTTMIQNLDNNTVNYFYFLINRFKVQLIIGGHGWSFGGSRVWVIFITCKPRESQCCSSARNRSHNLKK